MVGTALYQEGRGDDARRSRKTRGGRLPGVHTTPAPATTLASTFTTKPWM
jgi:hypothetical protein